MLLLLGATAAALFLSCAAAPPASQRQVNITANALFIFVSFPLEMPITVPQIIFLGHAGFYPALLKLWGASLIFLAFGFLSVSLSSAVFLCV
ncbi:MAG: hypothetical protein WKF30_01150 [Pyrinomonadaceae bacterium]